MKKKRDNEGRSTPAARRKSATKRHANSARRWSKSVSEHSNALELEPSVFTRAPAAIARSLKRSAEQSSRRKASPFRSAMSMLTFYENRAGRNLSPARKRAVLRAKEELRKLFGRE